MCRRLTPILSALLISLVCLWQTSSAIEIAGELFVDLDASTLSEGATLWPNAGSYADFDADGSPFVSLDPVPAVYFDGSSAFIGADVAPDGLVGFDPTRTIEVWAYNPEIASEETLVSWGKRGGPDGSNMAFNYGDHGNFGAVGHWGGGGPDVGWIDNDFTPGAPEAEAWHHLVYTYDEEIARVYSDGQLMNEEDMVQWGGLDTHPDAAIAIASQWEADGVTLNGGLQGSLFISKVRIHDEVLSDAQILSNYNEEKDGFTEEPSFPPPPPPPPALGGLWRFEDAGNLGLDSSDAGADLEESGGVSHDASGKIGDGALALDGVDGMLFADQFPESIPTGDSAYTISAWIQPDETGARGIVGWGAYGSGRSVNALRTFNDNGFRHYWWGADLDAQDADVDDAGVDLDDGEWHHIAAVYDGEDERTLYLNGALLVTDVPGDNNAVGSNFAVGRTCITCGGGEFFSGRLDDVAVFGIALTPEQIQSIMDGDFSEFLGSGIPGDFDNDGMVTAADIDLLGGAIRTNSDDPQFDLDGSGTLDEADLDSMIHDVLNTWFGDADLNGEFNSGDLVSVFTSGEYQDDVAGNSGWAEGDWTGDADFTSGDFVKAFTDGGYEVGPRPAAAAVPEPSAFYLAAVGLLAFAAQLRLRRR